MANDKEASFNQILQLQDQILDASTRLCQTLWGVSQAPHPLRAAPVSSHIYGHKSGTKNDPGVQ